MPTSSVGIGSSPLTRGKLLRRPRIHQTSRLIPAHAGKTRCPQGGSARGWAHPRSRGENLIVDRPANPQAGSSPLTRGKHARHPPRQSTNRLIPAHAGKTGVLGRGEVGHWAHPRSRGENSAVGAVCLSVGGSSPLTRGKLRRVLNPVPAARLIPAHAGKTRSPARRRTAWPAHPRSRGENMVSDGKVSLEDGSSPLTRGKPERRFQLLGCGRLIPAHAGKTCVVVVRGEGAWAHPRSRGENSRRSLVCP